MPLGIFCVYVKNTSKLLACHSAVRGISQQYVAFVGISVNVAKKNRKLCDLGHVLAYSIFKV